MIYVNKLYHHTSISSLLLLPLLLFLLLVLSSYVGTLKEDWEQVREMLRTSRNSHFSE